MQIFIDWQMVEVRMRAIGIETWAELSRKANININSVNKKGKGFSSHTLEKLANTLECDPKMLILVVQSK